MKKFFKMRLNTATALFLILYAVYFVQLMITKQWDAVPMVGIFGLILLAFFLGCRPYGYDVEKRTVTIKYYLWKNKEVDLMQCEVICDPVSRWADIATRPHAIEIYTNTKKRYCFFPKKRVEFVDAIIKENKRIHCTVKEYTDVHRKSEKRRRRENKREDRENAEK